MQPAQITPHSQLGQPMPPAPSRRVLIRCRPASCRRPLRGIAAAAALAALTALPMFGAWPARTVVAQTPPPESLTVVDQMWGPISAMVGVGDRLYVAQGARLLVVDGWHGAAPTLVGRSPVLAGPSVDLAVDGDRAAVALWTGGVAVLDVADPRAPRVVTMIPAHEAANRVALAGDRLWVGHTGNGLVVYDLASDPPRELMSIGGQVNDLAAEDGRVAAVMAQTAGAPARRLLIWPDGANAPSLPDEVVEVAIPHGSEIAVVDGSVVVANGVGLTVHDAAAQPPWSALRQLDIACRPLSLVAGGGRAIVTCDIPHSLTHVVRIPPTGPLTIQASVSFPRWIESAWIDDAGVAVGLVGGGLRTYGGATPDGGLRGVSAIDLGPDIVAGSTQDGALVGLSGNWGQAWQARVLGARADGVERTPLPTLVEAQSPSEVQAIKAFGGRFVLAAHTGQDLEVGVASLVSGTWQLDSKRARVTSGMGIAVLPPLAPGAPTLVVVPAGDRVRTAVLKDGVIGPFDGRLPVKPEDMPFGIAAVDGQRVWFGSTTAAIGFERRADGWHPLATLSMPAVADAPMFVHVRAAGDTVFTLHGGTVRRWDIADPLQPRNVASEPVAGLRSGFGFTDASQERLWVGTDVGLSLFDIAAGGLMLINRIETRCQVTAWLPAPDGAVAPAWECGALVLRADGTAPTPAPWSPQPGVDLPGEPLATATPSPASPTAPVPTATPSPERTADPTTEPTEATRRWTIYLPWVNNAAWQH